MSFVLRYCCLDMYESDPALALASNSHIELLLLRSFDSFLLLFLFPRLISATITNNCIQSRRNQNCVICFHPLQSLLTFLLFRDFCGNTYARILFLLVFVFTLLNRSYRRCQIFVVSLHPFASLFDREVLVENSLLIVDYDFVEVVISRERYNTDRSVEETEGRAQRRPKPRIYRTKRKKSVEWSKTALVHSLKFICFSFILIWPELYYMIENNEYSQDSFEIKKYFAYKQLYCKNQKYFKSIVPFCEI